METLQQIVQTSFDPVHYIIIPDNSYRVLHFRSAYLFVREQDNSTVLHFNTVSCYMINF